MSSQRGATAPRTMPCSPLSPSGPCLENPGKWGGLSSLGHQSVSQVQEALLGSRLLPVFGDLPTPCCPAVPLLPSPGPVHLPGDTSPLSSAANPSGLHFRACDHGHKPHMRETEARGTKARPHPSASAYLPNTAPCHAPPPPPGPALCRGGKGTHTAEGLLVLCGAITAPTPD